MLASSATETVGPVSDQCEVNAVPCISTDVPWEAYFFGRGGDPAIGFDCTYHFFWGLGQIVKTFTSLWASVDTNRRVGAAWSNDSDGVALSSPAHGFPAGFKAAGYEVVDAGLFTPLSSDFSAQIAKLKAARCDILTGAFLPADFATFWAQCGQQGFRPKVATTAPGQAPGVPEPAQAAIDTCVGGSDKPDVDEACANAGLAKISDRLLADAGAP